MNITVECYSGYKAYERPLRFILGERRIEVAEIADRWYSEEARYFRVIGHDGHTYVLKYVERDDRWELASFTSKESPGSNSAPSSGKIRH